MNIPVIDQERPYREQGPAWLQLGGGRPYIVCRCGLNRIIPLHHVHADGRVTASFLCEPGCGFHEWLTLDGWTGQEFPPEVPS